jgi:hypothetical protein
MLRVMPEPVNPCFEVIRRYFAALRFTEKPSVQMAREINLLRRKYLSQIALRQSSQKIIRNIWQTFEPTVDRFRIFGYHPKR